MNFLDTRRTKATEPSPKVETRRLNKRRKAVEDDEMISRFFASTKDPQPTCRDPKSRRFESDGRRRSERISRQTHQHLSNVATSSLPPVDLPEIPFLGFGQRGPRPASREIHDILSSAISAQRQQKLHDRHLTASVLSRSTSPQRPPLRARHCGEDVRRNLAPCPSPHKKSRTPGHHYRGRAKYDHLVHIAENESKSIVSATILSSESKENHPPQRQHNIITGSSIRNEEKTISDAGAIPATQKTESCEVTKAPRKGGSLTMREPTDPPNDMSKQKSPEVPTRDACHGDNGHPAKSLADQNAQGSFTKALDQLIDKWKDKVTMPADLIENLRQTGCHQDEDAWQTVRAASPQQNMLSGEQAIQTAAEPPQSLPTPPLVPSAEALAHQATLNTGQSDDQDGTIWLKEPTLGNVSVRGERALPLDHAPCRPFQAYVNPAYTTWQTGPSIYERQMSIEVPQVKRQLDVQRTNPQIEQFTWSARPSVSRIYGTPQSLERAFNQSHWTNHAQEQFANPFVAQVHHDDNRSSPAGDASLSQYQDIDLRPEPNVERLDVSADDVGSTYRAPEEFHFLARPDDIMENHRQPRTSLPHLYAVRRSDLAEHDNRGQAPTSPRWNRVDEKTLHQPDDVQDKALAGFWRPNMLY